jgi:hypothetical protein
VLRFFGPDGAAPAVAELEEDSRGGPTVLKLSVLCKSLLLSND